MIKIINKKNCSGCTACYSICPVSAITMVEDEEGFRYPKVDVDKCINCGACDKVCIYENNNIINDTFDEPKVYGGWSKDTEYRKNGTSGGVFSNIAKYVIDNNGVVCGAAFDKNLEVKHIIVDNMIELKKINGSKYVQSNITNILYEIKQILDKGTLVLFSGTPCQVTGLLKFLNKKYPNLITIDLVCHGVPSPKVYRKYIEYLESKNKSKLEEIAFRTKITGWKRYSTYAKYKNGKYEIMYSKDNPYMRGFLRDIYLRPSCSNCMSSKLPRKSDITLGDFWGVAKKYTDLDDDKGTSLVLVNSPKGEAVIYKIFETLNLKTCKLEYAIADNPALINSAKENSNRISFFKELDNKSFDYLSKKYFPKINLVYKLRNKALLIIKKLIK